MFTYLRVVGHQLQRYLFACSESLLAELTIVCSCVQAGRGSLRVSFNTGNRGDAVTTLSCRFLQPGKCTDTGGCSPPTKWTCLCGGLLASSTPSHRTAIRTTIINNAERSRSAGLKVAGRHAQLLGHDVVIVSTFNGRV